MKQNMRSGTAYICRAAVIAALYVVLTLISAAFGFSSGAVQFRLSEMLCVLPVFTSAAIPGLAIGCFVANLVSGGVWLDVLFGSLATLLGAAAAYALRRWPYLAPLPTIIANVVIVTPILVWVYHVDTVWYLAAAGVALGEIVCCGVLGSVLTVALRNRKLFLKK